LNDYVGGQSFCCGEKELVSNNQTGDNTFETPDYEQLIFFYHPDHLGSTALVTDNDGNVVQSVAYIPYGEVFIEERNGTWNTPYLFNGKELDEETGLYYYGARYLNPTNGMWLSVDPMWEDYKGVSPYCYTLNNPVKLTDVEGEWVLNVVGAIVAGGLDLGAQAFGNLASGESAFGNISWGSVIISATEGAINPVGGIAKSATKAIAKSATKSIGKEILKGVGNEAGKAVAANVIDQKVFKGQDFDIKETGVELIKGAALGGLNKHGKQVTNKYIKGGDGVRLGEVKQRGKIVSTGKTKTTYCGKDVHFDDTYLGDKIVEASVGTTNMYIKKVAENNFQEK
jgi:RHS repeat-associated protein